ncbi:LAGLIDADG family homing endonuclease [Cytobacillus pseudoceanisediminis]|uniref:LAGLIDADG family homing endonuclease n=1 Tax=Cytobacillus pseudoceanisediminis TaxID=3051614 RepID=UPI003CEE5C9C
MKSYDVNEDFFKLWTRESAWVYRWLLTDGSVDEKRSQIRLMLKSHDKDVLEKIKNLMEFTGSVQHGEQKDGRKYSYLRICRKELSEDLFALGLARVEKTFNTSMPDLPEEVFWDFIRGVFEGDGSIRHRTGNTDALDMTVCGATKTFIEDLQTAFEKRGIFMRMSRNNSGVYTINTKSNADALRLCYFMYAKTDDGHRLSRKYNIYKNYINTYYDKVKRRSTQCNELVEVGLQNIS